MRNAALATALVVSGAALAGGCAATRPVVTAPRLEETPRAESLTADDAPIGLRRSVAADAYFWVKAKVLEGDAPGPFREAVAAMQDLRGELGADASQWEDLELPLGTASRASDLAASYEELPEKIEIGGRTVALREKALRLARALEDSESAFRRGPYRDHADAVGRAARELAARLVPREAEIVRAIEADMNLAGIDRPIVVTLVADAPYQGTFAGDDRGQRIACFVRVRGLEGSALVEAVLTESLHAIDEITVKAPTAMNMLRAELARRGLDASEPNVEMAVNTVTFAEAASLVRRFVEPRHRPSGEGGFYGVFAPAPAIVDAWNRHVDGEELSATVEAIARALGAAP